MADYRGRIAPQIPGFIGRAGQLLAPAGDDQGDGTAAALVSGSVSASPQRSTTAAVSTVAPLTTVQTIAAANANRLGLLIYNGSGADLSISLSATGSPVIWVIPAGNSFELPVAYTGAIYGTFASAVGADAVVTDFSP